jgi:hypothetical protein
MNELSCENAALLLSDALAADLDITRAEALNDHLAGCERCQGLAEALVRQDLALAELVGQTHVATMAARLRAALASEGGRRPADAAAIVAYAPQQFWPGHSFARSPWWAWGAVAAAAALLVATLATVMTKPDRKVARMPAPSFSLPPQSDTVAGASAPALPPRNPPLADSPPPPRRITAPEPPSPEAIAMLELAEGEVYALDATTEAATRLKAGQPLDSGAGLWVKDGASAAVKFPDGTLLQVSAGTRIRRLTVDQGKYVELAEGALTADVSPQPADRPMILKTPKAEAVVLGTKLRLAANVETASLKVENGRVRFIRHADGKSLVVPQGHYAVVAKDVEFAVRPLTPPGPRWARVREQNGAILAAAFAPDGHTLATAGSDAIIRLWDPDARAVRASLRGHTAPIEALAFAADGRTLASAGWDHSIRLWDPATNKLKKVWEGHASTVTSLAFAPDGLTLASGGFDQSVKIWSSATGKERATLEGHRGAVRSVAFSASGKLLASGSADGAVAIWDPATGNNLRWLRDQGSWVYRVAFVPESQMLAAGDGEGGIQLWEFAAGLREQRLTGHRKRITGLAATPNGRQLVSSSMDGTVLLWDVASGKEIERLGDAPLGEVTALAVSPDGKWLAIGGADGSIVFWELANENKLE